MQAAWHRASAGSAPMVGIVKEGKRMVVVGLDFELYSDGAPEIVCRNLQSKAAWTVKSYLYFRTAR